jgi:hypothetical protein
MSTLRLVVAAFFMTFATLGWSQASPENHAAHHPAEKAQATSPPAEGHGMDMPSKDDMAVTRGLIERAEQARNSAERERLLDEHLVAMRKQLDALRSQQCSMEKMDGAMMGGKPAEDVKPGMMSGGMKDGHMMMCHQMMNAHRDTLAELLEQTWRREELRKKGLK